MKKFAGLVIVLFMLLSFGVAEGQEPKDICITMIQGVAFVEKDRALFYVFTLLTKGVTAAEHFLNSAMEEGGVAAYDQGILVILIEEDKMIRKVMFPNGTIVWVIPGAVKCRRDVNR